MEKDKKYIYKSQELTYKELINENGWFYQFQDESLNSVLISCKDFNNYFFENS